jgi:hypothetical protein
MKTDNAAFKLMDMGFKAETLASLTESQLVKLYNKLNEQVTPAGNVTKQTKQVTTYSVPPGSETEVPTGGKNVVVSTKGGKTSITPMESEMKEGKSKSKKYNPWAICTSTVGRENKKKYERCVMGIKKAVKEGRDPSELFLENKIVSLLERHIQPKISKKEFLDMIQESETQTPVKPKVPTVNPGEKTKRPSTPYKPKEGVKPAPKAKSKIKSKVETKEQSSPTIAPPKEKEKTKTPSTPYRPKPGVKPAPKAGKKSVPSWLKWNDLGINF